VLIQADEHSEMDLIGGSANAAAGIAAGASLTAASVKKVTEAYVATADNGRALAAAQVTADGTGAGIQANSGDFVITFGAESGGAAEVGTPSIVGTLVDILKFVFDNPILKAISDVLDITPVSAPKD